MADSRQRVPLTASYSFTEPSMTDPTSRSLKRRLSTSGTDPAYFNSATSFRPYNPEPEIPHGQPQQASLSAAAAPAPPTAPQAQSFRVSSTSRNISGRSSRNPALSLDVSPLDPGVVFIHPPFTDFPEAHKYKDGLTYNLLVVHEWYLDPVDYISPERNNPNAIKYPTQLEPPRGWCGKRKDGEPWPEGEEPRLRCTFCRRDYIGVNAKSMWRRHVIEKHGVPMGNRRLAFDGKGRSANKENKASKSKAKKTARSPTTEPGLSALSAEMYDSAEDRSGADWSHSQSMNESTTTQSTEPSNTGTVELEEDELFRSMQLTSTPPVTPGFSPSEAGSIRQQKFALTAESPYDPLVTPSFRHSPARLPSDQPWRFPSPSHPLHSARDLPLCMLIRGEPSPAVSGLDVSPVVRVSPSIRGKGSMFSSPFASVLVDALDKGSPFRLGKRGIFSSPFAPDSPDKRIFSDPDEESVNPVLPSPRKLFYDGDNSVSMTNRETFKHYRIPDSPLDPSQVGPSRLAALLGGDSWDADISLSPNLRPAGGSDACASLLAPIELHDGDVFAPIVPSEDFYDSWVDLDGSANESSGEGSPPDSSAEEEGPASQPTPPDIPHILPVSQPSSGSSNSSGGRTRQFTSDHGPGLLDAVLLSRRRSRSSRRKHKSSHRANGAPGRMGWNLDDFLNNVSPTRMGKKPQSGTMTAFIHVSEDDDDGGDDDGDYDSDAEPSEAYQPKKRRKTFDGRS